jgi:carboxymethylenebutenolidase
MTQIAVPYFCARPRAASSAGVLLFMEGNGMSPQLLRVAQRLAGEGYHVVAPDVFHRFGGSDPERSMAEGHIWKLTDDEVVADVRECVETLRDFGCTKLGATGFCMGGRLSYLAASRGLVDAAAPFYGVNMSELPAPTCPLAISMGSLDAYVPAADLAALQARHGDDLVVYEGADHGFFRDGSPAYHPDSASRAWARVTHLFATQLHPGI